MLGFIAKGRSVAKLFVPPAPRSPGFRSEAERIVLGVREGCEPSAKPPVRIFVGTEPGQYRAERVFVWSVEKMRDPSRVYEVHLMKDLAGFDRSRWLTGFTNYRFAVPRIAGGVGRAIYNDVDQVYLADPGELFDTEMQGHGFLAISDRDTSVMLIDCERMARVWRLEDARYERRKRMEEKARAVTGLWGPLAREWNARDEEYVCGRSKLLHYTTIHTQPWQPFPERYVYQWNPVGDVWHELEREADAARFLVFTRERPSRAYLELRAQAAAAAPRARRPNGSSGRSAEFLRDAGIASVLVYGDDAAGEIEAQTGATASYGDLFALGDGPVLRAGAVLCRSGLEAMPDEDLPWIVDALFCRAERAVCIEVHDVERGTPARDGLDRHVRRRGEAWWTTLLESTAVRHPGVSWQLALRRPGPGDVTRPKIRCGGPGADGRPPRVWVLTDGKAGHTTQSMGLAGAIGWPYEVKELSFNSLDRIRFVRRGLHGASTLALDRSRSPRLEPPWPDLVIATGRRPAPIARWIREQSRGRTCLVQIGRKAGPAGAFDLTVSCPHFHLPSHARREEVIVPITAITPDRLTREASRLSQSLFGSGPHPHVALIVGGSSAAHTLDRETGRCMAEEVAAAVREAGGTLFVVTSPRTGAEVIEALQAGIGDPGRVYAWRRGDAVNPYLAALALADVLVVTGDSESMIAEAIAAEKPLYIYPVPERRPHLRARLRAWITRRSLARPRKAKGTVRPQQGAELFCARLIEWGIVRPQRDLREMHALLIERGLARPFGGPLETGWQKPWPGLYRVVARVRRLLGHPPCSEARQS